MALNFHDRWKLEFSEDDLSVSNSAATWVDVTGSVRAGSMKWSSGIERIGDAPQPGQMSFTMVGRDFEPLNSASPYYPNVKRWARFRLSLDRGAGFESEFVGYARTFQPQWPGGTSYEEVDIVCGDGFDVLARNTLPLLDPPDATSHPEVVGADDPTFYARMGEPAGEKLVSHLRSPRWRRRHPKATRRQKHYRTRETQAALEGVSGPTGIYVNTPTLGTTGLVLGDTDTCATFSGASLEHAVVVFDDPITMAEVTFEALVSLRGLLGVGESYRVLMGGGLQLTAVNIAGDFGWAVDMSVNESPFLVGPFAGATQVVDTTVLLQVTWSTTEGAVQIFIDGELAATDDPSLVLTPSSALSTLIIGDNGSPAAISVSIDEVAIYETVLPPARMAAHAASALERGFPEQSAQDRITALALTDVDVPWDSITIAAGDSFDVQPSMKAGQSRLDEIVRALAAEGVRAHFFFGRDGNPVVLGWEWQSTGSYSTVQAAFGAPAGVGEIEFNDLAIAYDDEAYNLLRLSRENGNTVTVQDDTSISDNGETAAEPIVGLLNADDGDVALLGQEFVMLYGEPTWTLTQLDLLGADDERLAEILDRDIGDLLQFRRAGESGPDIEVLTWILGYEKSIDAGDVLGCTWRLARGWNLAEGVWRLGIPGFTELGDTTVLA